MVIDLEARHILEAHLSTLALGGNHPNAVVVPREALQVLLAHRCERQTTGEFVAVLPDGEVVGMFPTLAAVANWAKSQPDGDKIVQTSVTSVEATA